MRKLKEFVDSLSDDELIEFDEIWREKRAVFNKRRRENICFSLESVINDATDKLIGDEVMHIEVDDGINDSITLCCGDKVIISIYNS